MARIPTSNGRGRCVLGGSTAAPCMAAACGKHHWGLRGHGYYRPLNRRANLRPVLSLMPVLRVNSGTR